MIIFLCQMNKVSIFADLLSIWWGLRVWISIWWGFYFQCFNINMLTYFRDKEWKVHLDRRWGTSMDCAKCQWRGCTYPPPHWACTLSLGTAWYVYLSYPVQYLKYFILAPYILGIWITEVNAKDMISGGALWELVRISRDCSREDIRTLARRILNSSPTFRAELRRLRIDYWLPLGCAALDLFCCLH